MLAGRLSSGRCKAAGHPSVQEVFAAASSPAVLGTVPVQEVALWLVLLARCLAGEAALMHKLVDAWPVLLPQTQLRKGAMEAAQRESEERQVVGTISGFLCRVDQLLECTHAALLAC
eukprot:gene3507-3777_t